MYKCSVCDRSYASRASVKRHEQDVHSPKYYCDRCSYKTVHRKELEKHYGEHASSCAPSRVYSKTPVSAPIKYTKAPCTLSRPRSRSRSPIPRRKSPSHHRSSPPRSTTPLMDEADQAVDVESESDSNLLDLTCGRKREMPSSLVPSTSRGPEIRSSDAEVQVRPADLDGSIIRNRLEQLRQRAEATSVTDSIDSTTRLVLRPGRVWTRRTERYITATGEWLEVLTDTVAES